MIPLVRKNNFKILDLGLVDFEESKKVQRSAFLDVKNGLFNAVLIICRLNPVITLGRQASSDSLLGSIQDILDNKIKIYTIERGGNATYHGPGQITVYPILNLSHFNKDTHWFLRRLEALIIGFLCRFEVKAKRIDKFTGVWINESKIASIGIAVRNWISTYGLSINILENDLRNFKLIKPCGLDISVTSLEKETGKRFNILTVNDGFKNHVDRTFAALFNN